VLNPIEPLESRRLLSGGILDLTNNKLVVSNGNVGLTTLVQAGTNGQSSSPSDVQVMYTYAGDANLDGKVNADDYFLIDRNHNTPSAGWLNADFNYDGVVNGDDYAFIDAAFAAQGAPAAIGNQNAVGGTEGNDRIIVTWTNDYVSVPDGAFGHFTIKRNHNTIETTSKDLTLDAKGGDDLIWIQSIPDDADARISIYGGDGNDTVIGGAEPDKIFAGEGNDVVSAGDGKDTVYGEAGDDSIRGGGSNDLLDGGDGADTLRGDAGNDNIAGGANSDRLRGSLGNDTLDGGGGRDFLAGEAGDDSLIGGAGDDVCDGGAGADSMDGGSGHDQLLMSSRDLDQCDPQERDDGEAMDVDASIQVVGKTSSASSTSGLQKTGVGTIMFSGVAKPSQP